MNYKFSIIPDSSTRNFLKDGNALELFWVAFYIQKVSNGIHSRGLPAIYIYFNYVNNRRVHTGTKNLFFFIQKISKHVVIAKF